MAPGSAPVGLPSTIVRLAALVTDYGGVLTDADGMAGEPPLVGVLRQARGHGLRTALLSNADSRSELPASELFDLAELFDVTVVSGELGVRKPDPRIYALTADRLGVPVDGCVFVDDLAVNVRGAVAAGMVGVHHTAVDSTVLELAAIFDVEFTAGAEH